MTTTEQLMFMREDFANLYIINEVDNIRLRNRIEGEPKISSNEIAGLVSYYNDNFAPQLNYWLSIFYRNRDPTTKNYAQMIIKYLAVHGNPIIRVPERFDFVSFTELRKNLVRTDGLGRPRKNQQNKIPYRETMGRVLKQLVEANIIETIAKVEKYPRSSPDKHKTTSYYRLNAMKVHFTKVQEYVADVVLGSENDKKLSYNDLKNKANNAILSYHHTYMELKNFNEYNISKLEVAYSLLKEFGIQDPDNEIMDKIKQADPELYHHMKYQNPREFKNIFWTETVYRDFKGTIKPKE